jgi:excisionase family DNA binding protein
VLPVTVGKSEPAPTNLEHDKMRAAQLQPESLGDRFVSVNQAAHYLGITSQSVRNMLADGRLKAWTLGPRVLRIRLSDIEAALKPYGAA